MAYKKKITNQTFPNERDLYNESDLLLEKCLFKGEEDGESALKESQNIKVVDSTFALRYPLWHVNKCVLDNVVMEVTCRAPMWYSNYVDITDSFLHGPKLIRECYDININNSDIESNEFAWKSKKITLNKCKFKSEYAFLDSSDVTINDSSLEGKYFFQYVNGGTIKNSNIVTKDAFWHAENMYIYDSYIKSEYLGWYSKNLHFINCTIEGMQPLCYATGLVLENCKMVNCNLSFEYSDVKAKINGNIDSIKNPLSGEIICDKVNEIILNNSKYPNKCVIKEKK